MSRLRLNPTMRRYPLTTSTPVISTTTNTTPTTGSAPVSEPGPSPSLRPQPEAPPPEGQDREAYKIYHIWRSRDNRKGRHAVIIPRDFRFPIPDEKKTSKEIAGRASNTLAGTARGLVRMASEYPVWDVSYDVAVVFTLGVYFCLPF